MSEVKHSHVTRTPVVERVLIGGSLFLSTGVIVAAFRGDFDKVADRLIWCGISMVIGCWLRQSRTGNKSRLLAGGIVAGATMVVLGGAVLMMLIVIDGIHLITKAMR